MDKFVSVLFTRSVVTKTKKSPDEFLRLFLLEDFGRVDFSDISSGALSEIEAVVKDELKDIWRCCVALELLRVKIEGASPPADIVTQFSQFSPFGNEVSLAQALELEWAMAVIPLNVEGAEYGELAHLWITHGLGLNKPRLDGIREFPEKADMVVLPPQPFTGRSWQLGAALAMMAAVNFDSTAKLNLTRKWIITGKLKGDWITGDPATEAVEVGNKMSANVVKAYLFPRENVGKATYSRRTWYAGSLSEAYNLVSGQGIVELGAIKPAQGMELHSLVSERFYSILAAVFIYRPKKLVLWHSDNMDKSIKQSRVVRDVLNDLASKELFPEIPILLKEINSTLSSEAEANLKEYFLGREEDDEILFNIGVGNHLMRFAVQLLAVEKQFTLIYKDFDDKEPCAMICLRRQKTGNWGTYSINEQCEERFNLKALDNLMKHKDFIKNYEKEEDLRNVVLSHLIGT